MEIVSDQALVALQGPKAVDVLSGLLDTDHVNDLYFFFTKKLSLCGTVCSVSRSGYTGEDGFEISIPIDKSIPIVTKMLENDQCTLAVYQLQDD